ncbi:MAG: DUF1015 domain-containing protein [Acidobacteria bacterium]|nr:DUF1015 domain-containing protein [Acidobacteriota bacterium]
MATVFPFRALRPTPASAGRVAAVPYDVISTEEAKALAAGNPLSFLHVSRAEIDLPPGTNPYSPAVYEKAAENFATLRRAAPLVVEAAPSVYFYRLRMGAHVQTGVAACYSLDEYDRDLIKKHEKTRPDKEDDRTRHMVVLRAQTGPVFLTYRRSSEIDAIERAVTAGAPLFDVEAADDVRHTIWLVGGAASTRVVEAFGRVPALYIADGHHRAASAARARAELRVTGSADADTMLGVAFPDSQVQILPYNRVVRDLGGLTSAALLDRLRAGLEVKENGAARPSRKGEVALYVAGRWRTIVLSAPSGHQASAASSLDASLLHEQVLAPTLGIGDPRTDKRLDFVGGARGTEALERMVNNGQAAAACSMYPVGVDELMRIADSGDIMPPKTTWFEPKLRDGLLIHEI